MNTLTAKDFIEHHLEKISSVNELLSASNSIVISSTQGKDGINQVISLFKDDIWHLPDNLFVQNHPEHMKVLNFKKVPKQFQLISKVTCLKYYLNGREGSIRPRGSTIVSFLKNTRLFFSYLNKLRVNSLIDVTKLMCSSYVQACHQGVNSITGKNHSNKTLIGKFSSIEALFELSQGTFSPMRSPWPGTSSFYLSGLQGGINKTASTQIIPDKILSDIFSRAVAHLNDADSLLTIRDEIERIRIQNLTLVDSVICDKVNRFLISLDYKGGLRAFNQKLSLILDSCLITILVTSGIRVHELASLTINSAYTTLHNEEKYYWMMGRSEKTHEGNTDWLVTAITHQAIKIAIRLLSPLHTELNQLIKTMDTLNVVQTNKLQRQKNILLLIKKNKQFHTLSSPAIRNKINKFAQFYGIDWHFTPHQFRRTFAVYAAQSAFGDLRYLREHFKHWSLDMTALYALNEQQDTELYDDIMIAIKNNKVSIVEHWLEEDTLITGGMSEQIISFRNKHQNVRIYESRKKLAETISEQIHIRATSVAWCTADLKGCLGGTGFEKTRCGKCCNAVIDVRKIPIWQEIHKQQLELRNISDIGPSGKERIERDIQRCEYVLKELGIQINNEEATSYE